MIGTYQTNIENVIDSEEKHKNSLNLNEDQENSQNFTNIDEFYQ